MPINPYNNGQVPQAPFGDIFAVRTPKTDAAVNRMQMQYWQDRQYERQQRLAQAAQLDKDFDRQATGIRDADVEDVANAYNDYATAKKRVLFDKTLQKDPVARAKAEIEANQKLAQYHATVQESKNAVNYFKALNGGMLKKPYDYREDAEDLLNHANTTPTKQLVSQGLLNGSAWMEQDEDLNPVEKLARGKDREFTVVTEPDANGGLTRRSLTYSAPNEPRAFQMGWLTGLNTKRKVGTLVRDFDRNVSDAEFAAAETEYRNALQDKGRWAKWGIAPQPINYDPQSEVERAVAYKTYRHFLDNEPVAKKETNVANTDKVIDKNFANRLKAMAIAQGYKKEMANLHAKLKASSKDEKIWAEEAFDKWKSGDLEGMREVFNRLKIAGKKNFQHYNMGVNTEDGGAIITYDVTEKDKNNMPVVVHKSLVLHPDDDMAFYDLTKLEAEVKGVSLKDMKRISTGAKPGLMPKLPGKKTKSFKGVPKGGF